ncbi:MAG: hypothetical protein WCW84_08000 [Sulfurimonas sp.]|jgi:hypothetical protein
MNESKDSTENPVVEKIVEGIDNIPSIDTKETSLAINSALGTNVKKNGLINKRIDFDQRTLKRIATMTPVYSDEVGDGSSNNDIMSYVIAKGIDALFEGDFKRKIDEL